MPTKILVLSIASVVILLGSSRVFADASRWEFGAVLDVAQTSKKAELGYRDRDLALGHSDVLIRGPLGAALSAESILATHMVDGRLEVHAERLLISTRMLPLGLSAVAGRFASQIGYLNEQHPHADDFTERPLLYRGFLGNHWFDDGLRLNWVAPTPFYLRIGAESFTGRQLIKEAETKPSIGAWTFSAKTGGDFNPSNSWQFGLSYLGNRRQAEVHEHGGNETVHDHVHGAAFSGRHMWISDLVYKWAPNGNPKQEQVRMVWEHAVVSGIHPESGSLRHAGSTLGAVWRFQPSWELGLRSDWLRVNKPEFHEDDGNGVGRSLEFGAARLREQSLMTAYKPNHRQTYRLQYSQQRAVGPDAADVFARPASRVIQFQVVIGFGAHSAHSF